MSGPKTFAAQMDAALQEIFKLQAELQMRFDELSHMRISDKTRDIEISAAEETENIRERLAEALKAYTIPANLFKSEQTIRQEVRNRQNELKSLIDRIAIAENQFEQKREDYDAYIEYGQTVQAFKKAVSDRKIAACAIIEKYSVKDQPEKSALAVASVDTITLDEPVPPFELNFRKKKKQLFAQLHHKVENTENAIAGIVTKMQPPLPVQETVKKTPAGIDKRVRQINGLIAEAENPHQAYLYKQRLDKLLKSKTFCEEYFYIELIEDIRQTEKTLLLKQAVKKILARLNLASIHPASAHLQRELIANALSLIEREKIGDNEIQDIEMKAGKFLKQNEMLTSQELIRQKEHQYVKSQIIESLRIRRYEVIEESEVIDFEKESDFLMKIPGQTNFLNLRFNEDGTFLYNFLIPDEKKDLGIGQTQQKLSEMTSTCTDFRTMLTELAAAGLNVGLTQEKEVSESALIRIPAKLKTRLESAEQRRSNKTQPKERTLKRQE